MASKTRERLTAADRAWGFRFGVDDLVSIREAIRMLSVSRSTLYNLIEDGKIRRGNIGRKVVICRRSINEYLKTIEV